MIGYGEILHQNCTAVVGKFVVKLLWKHKGDCMISSTLCMFVITSFSERLYLYIICSCLTALAFFIWAMPPQWITLKTACGRRHKKAIKTPSGSGAVSLETCAFYIQLSFPDDLINVKIELKWLCISIVWTLRAWSQGICLLQICGRLFSHREQPLILSMLECDSNSTRR